MSIRTSLLHATGVCVLVAAALFATTMAPAPAVAAGTWSQPATLLSDPAMRADEQHVAVSADGSTAVAVWRETSMGGGGLRSRVAAMSGPSAVWSPITPMPSMGTTPRVAIADDGTKAVAVWVGGSWESWNVQAATATIVGGVITWSEATTFESTTGDMPVGLPQVALSADGTRATVIWTIVGSAEPRHVKSASATIVDNLATWSSITNITPSSNFDAANPDVALSADGTVAIAVWSEAWGSQEESRFQTASATIDGATATWSTATELTPFAPGDNFRDPKVAISADGTRATALWLDIISGNNVVRSASASINAGVVTWSAIVDVSQPGGVMGPTGAPQLGLSDDGSIAIAIWTRDYVVQTASATISGNVATWSTPLDLRTAPNGYPDIALSGDGRTALGVWNNEVNEAAEAAIATVSGATVSWSSPTVLSSPRAFHSQAAISRNGTSAIAVWDREIGDNWPVEASTIAIASLPGAPTGVTATPGDGEVTLSWTAPVDGGSSISAFTVTGDPAGSCVTTVGTSCVVESLMNGTEYSFTVVATNAAGDGPASERVTATPGIGSNAVSPRFTG